MENEMTWENDKVQFARLITELELAGAFTDKVLTELCEEMTLNNESIFELLDRAHTVFDNAKAQL